MSWPFDGDYLFKMVLKTPKKEQLCSLDYPKTG